MQTVFSSSQATLFRPTSFESVEPSGGSASIEKISYNLNDVKTKFVKRQESGSERPELGNAKIIIYGRNVRQFGR